MMRWPAVGQLWHALYGGAPSGVFGKQKSGTGLLGVRVVGDLSLLRDVGNTRVRGWSWVEVHGQFARADHGGNGQ